METVISKDGTRIAYDRTGRGEPVILVAGAFSYRKYPAQVKLAELLSAHFTVFNYDRRGRGDSGDTPPYRVEREIEDLEAMVGAAGKPACVWGLSSGAALGLRSATAGLAIKKLALQEPPFVVEPGDRRPPAELRARVSELVAAGQRGAPVKYFMTEGMGAPSFVIPMLKVMPGAWAKLTAVAPTLPYDALLCEGYQSGQPLPAGEWDSVTMPALVMSGTEGESPASLRHAAAAVAKALPNAELVVRKGLGHAKKLTPKVIAATLTEFFRD
jgi:pimeloyl-ACP methyl ester carboxylesterase